MKTLLCAVVAVLCMARLDAASIRIDGTLSWKVKKPDCTFKLDGSIWNLSPAGTASGSLKMVLWATPAPFPSRGYAIAEHNLGQIGGNHYITNFTEKVPVSIPKITGKYHFSISILEYTYSGWLNRAYITTGEELLANGEFVTGTKWVIPVNPVIAPPARLNLKDGLVLTVRADEKLNMITSGTRSKTAITIRKKHKAKVVIAGDDWDYLYTYTTGKRLFATTKVPVGRLYLDPEDTTGSSTLTLYFQSPTSGFYKNIEENPDGGSTTWGVFNYKSPATP